MPSSRGRALSRRSPTRLIRPALPRLEPADRGRRHQVDALLEAAHAEPPHRQQHPGGVGDVDAVVAQAGERAVAEPLAVLRQVGAEPLQAAPVEEVARPARLALELVRDHLHLDVLGGARDALRLRQRHGVHGVAGRAAQLAGDVNEHGRGEHRQVVRAVAGPHVDGVAVDHRPDRVAAVQVVQGEVDRGAMPRHVDRPP